jgi:hypothetical protein
MIKNYVTNMISCLAVLTLSSGVSAWEMNQDLLKCEWEGEERSKCHIDQENLGIYSHYAIKIRIHYSYQNCHTHLGTTLLRIGVKNDTGAESPLFDYGRSSSVELTGKSFAFYDAKPTQTYHASQPGACKLVITDIMRLGPTDDVLGAIAAEIAEQKAIIDEEAPIAINQTTLFYYFGEDLEDTIQLLKKLKGSAKYVTQYDLLKGKYQTLTGNDWETSSDNLSGDENNEAMLVDIMQYSCDPHRDPSLKCTSYSTFKTAYEKLMQAKQALIGLRGRLVELGREESEVDLLLSRFSEKELKSYQI